MSSTDMSIELAILFPASINLGLKELSRAGATILLKLDISTDGAPL
jgi:hypothetical protein